MGAEGFQNALGYGVGTLAALESLRSPGGLGRFLTGEIQARENPNVRASLVNSPFSSGFLFTGGSRQPLSLGPGGTGPSAPQQVWQPNLPPLAPGAAVEQQIAQMEGQALAGLTPEQQQQAAMHGLGVTPTVSPAEIAAATQNLPPGSRVTFPMGPGGMKMSVSGGPFPKPPSATAGEVSTPFKLWQREHPRGTFEQYQKDINAAATEKARGTTQAREEVKLSTLTSTTRTMLETAPSVKNLASRVRKDMERVETGPFSGRWQELWARKIGGDDPGFIKLRTDMDLLSTALQRMHVGARGGTAMFQHFQDLLGTGQQSPANMNAAIDAIVEYADDKEAELKAAQGALRGGPRTGPGAEPGAPEVPTGNAQDLGDGFSVEFH